MTDVFNQQIIIVFPAVDATETKNDLIKALSATVRWRAAYKEEYENDDYNLALIAQLIEQLTVAT